MAMRRKRKASTCLDSTQTESPAWVSGKFPWGSLPTDLQKSIMSNLTVRETARLTWASKSSEARAIHREMMHSRHEALRDVLRDRFGEEAAVLMPPLDMANPGDVYITPQVPSLLQLRPHRKGYRRVCTTMVDVREFGLQHFLHLMEGSDEPRVRDHQVAGRCQGYFTQARLEGWGRWDACNAMLWTESFEGEWRAGKRHRGKWTSAGGLVCTGEFRNDRLHGRALAVTHTGMEFDCVFKDGRLLTRQLRKSQP